MTSPMQRCRIQYVAPTAEQLKRDTVVLIEGDVNHSLYKHSKDGDADCAAIIWISRLSSPNRGRGLLTVASALEHGMVQETIFLDENLVVAEDEKEADADQERHENLGTFPGRGLRGGLGVRIVQFRPPFDSYLTSPDQTEQKWG